MDFGEETIIEVRARPHGGAEAPETGAESLSVDGRLFSVSPPRPDEDPAWRASTRIGNVDVELRLVDHSELPAEAARELLAASLGCIDYDWISSRATPPRTLEFERDKLLPWPIPASHELASTAVCKSLPNGLGMSVAMVQAPWASVITPAHPAWQALGPAGLLDVATLNLVKMALDGELPAQRRTVRDMHILAIGPHPLAVACLMLPDLRLWAEQVVGGTGPLHAIPLLQNVLLVAPVHVDPPLDAWASAIAL